MVLDFVYIAIGISFALLFLSIFIKDYSVGMISGICMCCVGVYIAIYDIQNLNNLLTDALGLILLCLGAYIFLNLGIEQMEKLF